MKLKHDVFSTYRPAHKYGNAGEEVQVISDCDNVVIVQAASGSRFSVLKDCLTEEEIKINMIDLPDTQVTNPIIKQVQVSKKRAAPINQQTLF